MRQGSNGPTAESLSCPGLTIKLWRMTPALPACDAKKPLPDPERLPNL